jgi:hypothetical protein
MAAPQPPNTSQNVPINSAASREDIVGAVIQTPLLSLFTFSMVRHVTAGEVPKLSHSGAVARSDWRNFHLIDTQRRVAHQNLGHPKLAFRRSVHIVLLPVETQ